MLHICTELFARSAAELTPAQAQDVAHRRPYEVLLLARAGGSGSHGDSGGPASGAGVEAHPHNTPAACAEAAAAVLATAPPQPSKPLPGLLGAAGATVTPDAAAAARETAAMPSPLPPLLQHLVVAAVPGEHSRKPHLGQLLRCYVPPGSRCLEVRVQE